MTTQAHKQPYLFSYILKIDDGAAPNPFWGQCTLTICKPKIRKTADNGDWLSVQVGIITKSLLVFLYGDFCYKDFR